MGITRAQWRVLISLARHDNPSQSELAEALDVERITLCRMVDRLAEAGLVERRADPSDRRIWRLHLTDKAAPLVDGLGEMAKDMEEHIFSPLDAGQRQQLTEMLTMVRDHMRALDEQNDRLAVAEARP